MSLDQTAEYVRDFTVAVYDVGPDNLMKPGAVLRAVQETSEQHVDLLHIGYEELRDQAGLVFFLVSTRMRAFRFPAHREAVRVKTHPRGRGGVRFYRDFKFYDQSGALLIDVMQTTILADVQTHRVKRPQELFRFGVFHDAPIDPEEKITRIELPDGLPRLGRRTARRSDLDSNGHVNNAVYGDIVEDFLPEPVRPVRELQIDYLGETPSGEVLEIYGQRSGGAILLCGEHSGGASFAARVLEG